MLQYFVVLSLKNGTCVVPRTRMNALFCFTCCSCAVHRKYLQLYRCCCVISFFLQQLCKQKIRMYLNYSGIIWQRQCLLTQPRTSCCYLGCGSVHQNARAYIFPHTLSKPGSSLLRSLLHDRPVYFAGSKIWSFRSSLLKETPSPAETILRDTTVTLYFISVLDYYS